MEYNLHVRLSCSAEIGKHENEVKCFHCIVTCCGIFCCDKLTYPNVSLTEKHATFRYDTVDVQGVPPPKKKFPLKKLLELFSISRGITTHINNKRVIYIGRLWGEHTVEYKGIYSVDNFHTILFPHYVF